MALVVEHWVKVNLGVEIHVKDALLGVLHNDQNDPSYAGMPKDEQQLYQRMLLFKQRCKSNLKNLKENQWNILCPATGRSNSKDWNITLIVVVIIHEVPIPPPQGNGRATKR